MGIREIQDLVDKIREAKDDGSALGFLLELGNLLKSNNTDIKSFSWGLNLYDLHKKFGFILTSEFKAYINVVILRGFKDKEEAPQHITDIQELLLLGANLVCEQNSHPFDDVAEDRKREAVNFIIDQYNLPILQKIRQANTEYRQHLTTVASAEYARYLQVSDQGIDFKEGTSLGSLQQDVKQKALAVKSAEQTVERAKLALTTIMGKAQHFEDNKIDELITAAEQLYEKIMSLPQLHTKKDEAARLKAEPQRKYAAIKEEVDGLKERLRQLSETKQAKQEAYDSILFFGETTVERLSLQKIDLEKRNQELTVSLEEIESGTSELHEAINEKRRKLKALKAEQEVLLEERNAFAREAMPEKLEELERNFKRFFEQLTAHEQQKRELEAEQSSLTAELASLSQPSTTMTMHFLNKFISREDPVVATERITSALSDIKERLADIESFLPEIKRQFVKAKDDVETWTLKYGKGDLESDKTVFTEELEQLDTSVKLFGEQLLALEKEIAENEAALPVARDKLTEELLLVTQDLLVNQQDLQKEQTEYAKRIAAAEPQKQEIDRLEIELQNLRKQLGESASYSQNRLTTGKMLELDNAQDAKSRAEETERAASKTLADTLRQVKEALPESLAEEKFCGQYDLWIKDLDGARSNLQTQQSQLRASESKYKTALLEEKAAIVLKNKYDVVSEFSTKVNHANTRIAVGHVESGLATVINELARDRNPDTVFYLHCLIACSAFFIVPLLVTLPAVCLISYKRTGSVKYWDWKPDGVRKGADMQTCANELCTPPSYSPPHITVS